MSTMSQDEKYYSVLLATEKPFQENEMAQRLSETCSVVIARDRSKIMEDIPDPSDSLFCLHYRYDRYR